MHDPGSSQDRDQTHPSLPAHMRDLPALATDWIWCVDLQGNHTYSNPAIKDLLGFDIEEIVGSSAFPLMHPDDQDEVQRVFEDAVSNQTGWTGLDIRWLHRDGSVRYFETNAQPTFDDAGRLTGFCGIDRDVTDKRRTESELASSRVELEKLLAQQTEELHGSEARYKGIVENIPLLICRFKSSDGIITYVNDAYCEYFDMPAHELIGKSFFSLIPAEDHAYVRERFNALSLAAPVTDPYEHEVLTPSGERRVQRWIDQAVFDNHDDVVEYQSIGEDITENRNLEAQVRQAQKIEALGTLSGGIAHEFNNFLAAISGYTELTLVNVTNTDLVARYLNNVLISCRRAADLVEQILTFSRMEATRAEKVDLRSVLGSAVHMLRAAIPADIEIVESLDEDVGVAVADATQLHQVIVNLGTNAHHAIGERGGRIGVALRREGDRAVLLFEDNGSGIPATCLSRVFDPFFTTKGIGEGTGLGLAVVHGIVESHDGDIAIDSEEGRGTTVRISLPVSDKTEGPGEKSEVDAVQRHGEGHVLVVEDDRNLAALYTEYLTNLGYQVTGCSNGAEALQRFAEGADDFDVVLTDMAMPEMNGKELARRLLSMQPDLPIILSTGFSHVLSEEQALELGVRKYLMKPIALPVLASAIGECV